MITWKHTSADLVGADLNKKIDIFYEKLWGWTLYPAFLMMKGGRSHDNTRDIASIPHAGFACLHILLSYFEMIAKYLDGNASDKSKESFIRGVRYVFPTIDEMPYFATQQFLSSLYSGARCGLYHMSMTGYGIVITGGDETPEISYSQSGKEIILNPEKLPQALIDNLNKYCNCIRDPNQTDLRKKFEQRFDKEHPKK